MISKSAQGNAHFRALFPTACCEIVNLTIIIIQRITQAFDFAFDKSNVCGSHSSANANVYGTHSNANALKRLWRHLNANSNALHSNAHSNAQHSNTHSNAQHSNAHSNAQHSNAHSNAQHSNAHSDTFAFVNKPI